MPKKDIGKASRSYMKYSGLAFQMFGLLIAGWFMGSWLDRYFGFEDPYLGAGLALLFLVGQLYKLILDMNNDRL